MARDEAYREAEKKIEEARRSGAKELDLSAGYSTGSPKLTELPESLGELTQLQSLSLSNNQLKALPKWLRRLTQLQLLRLRDNQLTALSEPLGRLTQLQSLNLSNNHLILLAEWLGRLTQLRSLDLSRNQLKKLPESLGRLTQLRSLDLSINQLIALPKWLDQRTQLQSLNLSYNELTALPEWLGQLTKLQSLNLSYNGLTVLPECLGQLTQLHSLDLTSTGLTVLPEWLSQFKQLQTLYLNYNHLTSLPEWLGQFKELRELGLGSNKLETIPDSIGELQSLEYLELHGNQLTDLPESLGRLPRLTQLALGYLGLTNPLRELPRCVSKLKQLTSLWASNCGLQSLPVSLIELEHLKILELDGNPLSPELGAAYEEGLDAVKRYLRVKAGAQVVLNEGKLILIGEGEVGKSCLLDALRGDPWREHDSTHGIEIRSFKVTGPDSGTEITLNSWDFGGQRVCRPTHQLFFSAPTLYLVVWKPREGPQQGFVKEWIRLVKHREPDAKILVVATHGGPGQRQPDLNRQEIWDSFGKDTVIDFFHVDSKPNKRTGERRGIDDLKCAIAKVVVSLPEMGRSVPTRWQQAHEALTKTKKAYLPVAEVLKICKRHKINKKDAQLFVRIYSTLGHFIHYEHDPALRDIVILKPDWLATAISFVLDDKQTRDAHGLVSFARLGQLWNDPKRKKNLRCPSNLHPIFLRLMERFDLSYRVAGLRDDGQQDGTSLIAQLVPDVRPDPIPGWAVNTAEGDEQQMQICQIVDAKTGQSATAEGLFYQLIVRLHKYSLGRVNHVQSVHWQHGLVVDDDYNGRALLEQSGNDIRITVRAPYPERLLSALTYEVEWLVEDFWEGLRCDVMVPCVNPCGRSAPGTGLYEVQKLIESKKQKRPEYPCTVCYEWQDIDSLLRNAPAARLRPGEALLADLTEMKNQLTAVRQILIFQQDETIGRFDKLDISAQRILSKVDDAFSTLMKTMLDEAKDGPRLFSFQPVDPGFLDLPRWLSQKFRLTLWCEHSRLPLHSLNGNKKDKRGVYDLDLPREWLVKAAPFLKVLTGTLSLVLPVASSAVRLALDDATYKSIEKELDLARKTIESVSKGMERAKDLLGQESYEGEHGGAIEAQGAVLRQLHALLKQKDPTFGGLVRVRNKRQEFLWVHPQFEKEY